jgi:hypothetical protein
MAEVAIIIGNGFDIDLGLPSKYTDFIESKEWKDIKDVPLGYVGDKNYIKHSLICHLRQASYNKENWFELPYQGVLLNFAMQNVARRFWQR